MKRVRAARITRTVLLAACAGLAGHSASAQNMTAEEMECGTFFQISRLTPEDYRKPTARLKIVDDYHFGPMVESLIRPMQLGGTFGSDIDYTLWGYPNHHRALAALVRLGAKEKTDKPKGSQFTIDCYFRRALRIASDDLIVRMLYANYLGTINRKPDAMRHLAYVTETAGDSAMTHYNAGLSYLELRAYDEAAEQARMARKLGFGGTKLQEELQRLGKWPAEPEPAASAPAAPDQAASAAAG